MGRIILALLAAIAIVIGAAAAFAPSEQPAKLKIGSFEYNADPLHGRR